VKKTIKTFIAAAAVLFATSSAAFAQNNAVSTIGAGLIGGLSIPMGDFGDGFGTGFNAGGFVTANPSSLPVGLRFEGIFNRFGEKHDSGVKANIINGTVNGVFNIPTSSTTMQPYIIAGLGIYHNSLSCDGCDDIDSENKFGINGGFGIRMMRGSLGLFGEGRIHNVFTEDEATRYFPIAVGVVIK
jgi:hypothetical protein